MKRLNLFTMVAIAIMFVVVGCATDGQRGNGSRVGRAYKEPRAMNHRSLDSDSLYQACLREQPEISCRNRMGR